MTTYIYHYVEQISKGEAAESDSVCIIATFLMEHDAEAFVRDLKLRFPWREGSLISFQIKSLTCGVPVTFGTEETK
jgi:hypothetical protein